MITSSLSPRWKSLDLNSAPITGISPIHGRAFVLSRLVFCSNPAIAKLWPLPAPPLSLHAAQSVQGLSAYPLPSGTLTAPLVAELADLRADTQIESVSATAPSEPAQGSRRTA